MSELAKLLDVNAKLQEQIATLKDELIVAQANYKIQTLNCETHCERADKAEEQIATLTRQRDELKRSLSNSSSKKPPQPAT